MGSNLRTQEAIRLGESEGKTFYEIIEASYTFGWRTFDQACLEAYEEGAIADETALLYCTKRSVGFARPGQFQKIARRNGFQRRIAPHESRRRRRRKIRQARDPHPS